MRKTSAIFLLAAFALAFLSPLLAYGADGSTGLAACCRRSGTHHCMSMGVAPQGEPDGRSVGRVPEKCPYCPGAVQAGPHLDTSIVGVADAVFAEWVSHPCGVAQTESKRRIARDRARQKRGPPVVVKL